jgi:small conductance mechanosensitive channel
MLAAHDGTPRACKPAQRPPSCDHDVSREPRHRRITTPAADWFATASDVFKLYAIPFLWQVLGALGIWIVGGILIRFACRVVGTAMTARDLDRTLTYVTSALSILLRVVLIAGVLGMFGVESTSFAALLAAAGVAIGMAWAGLLANFAAGVFLVLLRPFKVGDIITAAGVSGQVVEIGLFATTLDTRDNIRISSATTSCSPTTSSTTRTTPTCASS